jgi:hypothetical protein
MFCLFEACIISAQILGGGSYSDPEPTLAVDSNSIVHNISSFYEIQNKQFDLKGYLILDTDTRVDLKFDNGLKSKKRIRTEALTIGITQLSIISEDSHVTFGVSTELGGRTTEIACTDDSGLDRQFFCDNLATLEPFTQPKHNKNTKLTVNYTYKF